MKKSVAEDDACTSERRITRSMTKSDVVLNRNNQVVRKKIKSGKEVTPYVPEELVYNILLLLPAKVLCDAMKLVCKLWCKVIRDPNFIKEHFSQSPNNSPFLVVSYFDFNTHKDHFELHFINKDETAWNFIRRINLKYLTHGSGLILTADLDDPSILYLLNPSTNQIVRLPKISIKYSKSRAGWVVVFSPLTSEYIVSCTNGAFTTAYILTVGVDNKWCKIGKPIKGQYRYFSMHRTWGCYIWTPLCKRHFVLSLEKEEIFYEVDFPKLELEGRFLYGSGVSSDKIVSVAIEKNRKCWHFWELLDLKNDVWRKLGSFDLGSKLREIKKIMGRSRKVEIEERTRPEVVIKGGDEVIFKSIYNRFFAYNFKTGTVSDSVPKPAVSHSTGRPKLVFFNNLVKAPGPFDQVS